MPQATINNHFLFDVVLKEVKMKGFTEDNTKFAHGTSYFERTIFESFCKNLLLYRFTGRYDCGFEYKLTVSLISSDGESVIQRKEIKRRSYEPLMDPWEKVNTPLISCFRWKTVKRYFFSGGGRWEASSGHIADGIRPKFVT